MIGCEVQLIPAGSMKFAGVNILLLLISAKSLLQNSRTNPFLGRR
jgi:hypothetical protein